MALIVGIYSATTTQFNFVQNHESNLKLISFLKNLPQCIREKELIVEVKCFDRVEKIKNAVSNCAARFSSGFRYAREKIVACCQYGQEDGDANENDSLVSRVQNSV